MNILVVEDEMIIAETIRMYLEERNHTVVDICMSYEEAIGAISNPQLDLVLIDVRLYGEKSGIDLASYIQDHCNLPFIFLTSQFDKRIIESAKKTHPQGYLTKPISKESLWTTIEIAYENYNESHKEEKSIAISDSGKTVFIKEDDIVYISADHVYSNLYTEHKNYIFRKSLQQLMEQLSAEHFIQCHRSYIVNMHKIDTIERDKIIISGNEIPISRSRKKAVLQSIEQLS